jgi:glycosyltransferase involved in cell wall biosynthesis
MSGMSGIGVYLDNVVENMIGLNQNNTFLLLGNKARLSRFETHSMCKVLHMDIPIFSFKELFQFPVDEINTCDCFYTPNFNIPGGIRIPVYSTIHDVVFMDIPDLTNKIGRYIRKIALIRALRISKKVFTVSEFSKSRILHHFRHSPEIIIAGGGVNMELKRYKKMKERPFDFSYILFIGNIKRHKGLSDLLAAYHLARNNGLKQKLVIVGNYDAFRTSDSQTIQLINEENENIVFTGAINDRDLFDFLTHATLLVQPSKYEGFGLPPLEALYLGCPVLLSDIPVFEENYMDFPVTFFHLEDIDDLSKKLLEESQAVHPALDLKSRVESRFSFANSATIILNNLLAY